MRQKSYRPIGVQVPAGINRTATNMPDRKVKYGSARSQTADLWLPAFEMSGRSDRKLPVVVLLHGGYWKAVYTKKLMQLLCSAICAEGWAAWNVEYRRLGTMGGGGGWPGTLSDVARAVDHLTQLPEADPSKIAVMGHSAGGQLALWTGARHRLPPSAPGSGPVIRPIATISLAGLSDLSEAARSNLGNGAVSKFLGGDTSQVPLRYRQASPLDLLPDGTSKLLVHGTNDSVVPISMSEKYAAGAEASGDSCRLIRVMGSGHLDMLNPSGDSWTAIREFLSEAFA